MGGVVEEDEVGGLCCVEELIMYVPKVPYLQESRRGSWGVVMVGLRTVFLYFFSTAYVTWK